MDTTAQSGRWTQNPTTGLLKRHSPPLLDPPPDHYYGPPPNPTSNDRRSFAERTGTTEPTYDPRLDTPPNPHRTVADAAVVKMNTRAALLDHEQLLDSPEQMNLVNKLHQHGGGGEAGSEHFAQTSHFTDSLPASMAISMGPTDSEHLSHTKHRSSMGQEDEPGDVQAEEGGVMYHAGGTTSDSLAEIPHVNETALPASSAQPPISQDEDDVPENLRTKPWSPPPEHDDEEVPEPPSATSTTAELPKRRVTVPERSPLQNLERVASKEEKRARVEEAENRAVQRQGTLRSEKGRVVSDGSRRPSESTSDKFYQNSPRHVSAGSAALGGLPPANGYSRSYARTSNGIPRIAKDPRPYHHAPETPRSLDAARHRDLGSGRGKPAIAHEPRPYHHAPAAPRNLDVARQRTVVKQEQPAIAQEPRPYHHAPEAPRSLDVARQKTLANNNQPAIAHEPRPYHHAPEAPRSLDVARQKTVANYDQPAIAQEPRPYHHAPVAPRSLDAAQKRDSLQEDRAFISRAYGDTPPIAKDPQPYHHAPDAPRTWGLAQYLYGEGGRFSGDQQSRHALTEMDGANGIDRTASGRYKHRLRDAGYVGAATAAAATAMGAGAGLAGYEAFSDKDQLGNKSQVNENVSRSDSKRLENNKTFGHGTIRRALRGEMSDPVPRDQVKTEHGNPLSYHIPPQTAAGQAAREQVGFDNQPEGQQHSHGRFGAMFHHNAAEGRAYRPAKPLEEWRSVAPLFLALSDVEFDQNRDNTSEGKDSAWWEHSRGGQRTSSSRSSQPSVPQYDGPFEEGAKLFQPPMFLKCGPLLRYTGIRREGEREIWRGSVMIVTEDEQSDYSTVPTLRIFAQPMELLQLPPKHLVQDDQPMAPEHEDPVAGQVKVSRTGRPLYVRHIRDIEPGVDLSREENNQGLYAATRPPQLASPSGQGGKPDKSRIHGRDGEKAGRYKEVRAVRLHAERGFTFWRWSIEIELGSQQHRVAYRINKGPALGFWVPARGETMNMMFHSCNGFSLSVDPNAFSGPDPLWRDVLNKHQTRPFHVMIGGGDQVYNDGAMRDTTLFREWLQTKNPESKHGADFSPEMQEELEAYYLHRYSMWFSQGLFAMAGSQIPMVNIWDDHDIIDGYGSYPHHFMSTRVFTGLGAIAFKYYMLFQHQSLAAETSQEEPSWVLGASPGPYINELARHVFLDLGRKVKFLGVDCRTERMRDEILSEASYDILFDKCRAEIKSGETKHLIVLLGVPIAYPRLNFLENILTSRVMDPIKAIGRTGVLGGFVNKFDGGVEILDDLDDHWSSRGHKHERNWFVQELQELAAEKSVRITILGGDVHLGAVGQFYTPKKFGVSKDRDHRYMPNVISSAIVNTPPPNVMADVLNRRNKVHHLDSETDEDMIPMFEVDVDGSKRNNKCLLPRRNYCTIREFEPGYTPPSTPPPERAASTGEFGEPAQGAGDAQRDRRFPPGSMAGRPRSLTRGPVGLIRRLSGSRSKNPPSSLAQAEGRSGLVRSQSLDGPHPVSSSSGGAGGVTSGADVGPGRPNFHRRPSNLTEKDLRRAAARGGAPATDEEGTPEDARQLGHINLEAGLDISLNMEIDQRDPLGATERYRLLVPALWYTGSPDVNDSRIKSKRGTLMERLRSNRRSYRRNVGEEGDSRSPSPDAGPERNAGYVATDGALDRRVNGVSSGAQKGEDEHAASYDRGYSLSGPPIGTQHQPPPLSASQQQPENQMPFGQDGQQQQQQHSDGDEGSVTSDEYVDAPDLQPNRRLSKAERFFGIGDAEGPTADPPRGAIGRWVGRKGGRRG